MGAVKVRQACDGGENGLDGRGDVAKRCSIGCSSSPWDDSEREEVVEPTVEVVEEIDPMVVLPEIGDAGDAEVVKSGGDIDRMDVLSEVQDPGGAGETDGMNELSEIEDDGSETERMDELLDALMVGNVGGNAEWMEATWNKNLRGYVNSVGLSKCPRFQAKAECWRDRLSCAGLWLVCFLSFGRE